MSSNPPRTLGILMVLLGMALIVAGVYIGLTGTYFLVIGAGIGLSGALIAAGKVAGAYLYGLTLAVILIWSFAEQHGNPSQLVSQIAIPLVLGFYIFSSKVRSRLA